MIEISVQGLTYFYEGKKIIDNINLSLKGGQSLLVTGPSGAGKSTLLRLLLGEIAANAGTIFIDNDSRIGYVPQENLLIDVLSARGNLELPFLLCGTGVDYSKILASATMFGIVDCLDRSISTLSGGEKRRLVVLQSIIFTPQIIIADEPLAGLDDISAEKCMDYLLKRCEEGVILILTSHKKIQLDSFTSIIDLCLS